MGVHIELSNPNRSYFAGQVVNGRVVVRNAIPDKIKQITILLQGTARVKWRKRTSSDEDRRKVFSAEETYIKNVISLFGDGQNSITLPEGITTYPFRFQLHNNLPSSFSSKTGHVSYILKGEIKRSLLKPNDRAKVPFTVNGIFDLNLKPGASSPQQYRRQVGANSLACRSGTLHYVFHLKNRTGFVPGESIDFRADIINNSNKKVTSMKVSLMQVADFYAKRKCKTVITEMSSVQGSSVDAGEDASWEETLRIPAVPPTGLGGNCRIIDLKYFLRFEMKMSGLSSSVVGGIPVMIGTIPLRSTFANFSQTGLVPMPRALPESQSPPIRPEMNQNHSSSIRVSPPSYEDVANFEPVFHDYPDLPPPSYAEAAGAERFTMDWDEDRPDNNGGGGDAHHQATGLGDNGIPISSVSTPPDYLYLPNYITYSVRV